MDIQAYRDEIRLRLTGDLLDLEITDTTLDKIINSALREIQRYICSTKIITLDYEKCLDFNSITDEYEQPIKISSITNIYRASSLNSVTGTDDSEYTTTTISSDPMYALQWQTLSGVGGMYNFENSILNYGSWSISQQIRNTLGTDLKFYFDKSANKLYINITQGTPDKITIEYIPRFDSVEEVDSDFWIDNLIRMATALAKITVGRIRTRYTESGALWTQDGSTILEEGKSELSDLRTYLQSNTQLNYPID